MTASTPFDAGAPRDEHPSRASASSTATRVRRRRRPSGEPPPLPRQLQTSGRRWLLLIGVVVVAGVAIGTVRSAAVAADVVDHAVLSAFERIRTSWLTQAARAAGVLATPLGLLAVWWATLAVLLVWRRWRHLLVCAVALFVVTLGSSLAVDMLRRPRPLGLETLGDCNFAGPTPGVLTRLSSDPDPRADRLYGTTVGSLRCDALPVRFDPERWKERFLAQWPPGSHGHRSYFARITRGADLRLQQPARVGVQLTAHREQP